MTFTEVLKFGPHFENLLILASLSLWTAGEGSCSLTHTPRIQNFKNMLVRLKVRNSQVVCDFQIHKNLLKQLNI